MMADDRWRNEDLIEEYFNMTQLLAKRSILGQHEKKEFGKRIQKQHNSLRHQVTEGRVRLQKSLSGDIEQNLRLILIDHKDMQRLYTKMPLHEVEDNINQRTFVMRKKRDRVSCQLDKLKKNMERKLIDRSQLETRMRFQNEFLLQEEIDLNALHKKVENSQNRLMAIQSINTTYKKIIQILANDQKFHEPILQSLDKDIEDQQSFICHIIYEGAPAIGRLNELKEKSRRVEESKRKQRHSKTQLLGELQRSSFNMKKSNHLKASSPVINVGKHYVRETHSILAMKMDLTKIEDKMKAMQQATLSTKPEHIYSTLKQQTNHNLELSKEISLKTMESHILTYKCPSLSYSKQFLKDEFTHITQHQADYVQDLKTLIDEEDAKEEEILNSLKQHSNIAVVFRCSLWNIYDILRHVHLEHESRVKHIDYPKSYLNLPLLKYVEMEMKAVPPNDFEENTLKVLNIITHKLKKLMSVHNGIMAAFKNDELRENIIVHNRAEYCSEYLERGQTEEITTDLLSQHNIEKRMSADESSKKDLNLTRKYFKDLSTKLVEISLKKDE